METAIIEPVDAQCERCGRCLHVCPSYRHLGIETFSPRGRLDLIRARACHEFLPGFRYSESMESCLQCLACSHVCPKGVTSAAVIRQEKARLMDDKPGLRTVMERMLLTVILSNRHALYTVTAALARLQRFFLKDDASTVRHLPLFLPEMIAGRRIPVLSINSVFSEFPRTVDPPAGIRVTRRVMLYTGCFFGYADTGPVKAAIRVLRENGYRVRIPMNQTCCGAPSLMGGYPDIARRTAEKNLAALEGHEPIITLCATCGNFLKNDYPELFANDSQKSDNALRLSGRICDINSFLADHPALRLGNTPVRRKVTIHDPCHLKRGLDVSGEIRHLLRRLPGLELHEMEDSDDCCGGGGLCALNNPKLSRTLGNAKADSILDTDARMAATPCPGCLLQISDCLSRKNSSVEAVHPVELMAMTFGP